MSQTALPLQRSPSTLLASLLQALPNQLCPPDDYDKPTLLQFVRDAWHVVEPSTPYVHGFHIEAIAEHLTAVTTGQIRNLLINMPPRHAKSLLVSVFWPCWEWIEHPERRWLYSSYGQNLSTRDSLKCRRLIDSPWYRQNWGGRFRLTSDQNVKTRFENDKTGYRIATSVGGGATGEGGDRIVVDDPHNVKEAPSEAKREAALTWWDETMSTRLNDPKTGVKVIVMQRVHQNDLSGHVLERGGYEHLCLPARFEPKRRTVTGVGWTDPRTEDGDLLWPARFGETELAALEHEMGSRVAAGQLQQRPAPDEGGLIKRAWVHYYTELPDLEEMIQSWDCTFKDTKNSDFVAGHVWGRKGADRYLVARRHGRMDMPATVAAVRAMSNDWPQAHAKLVEDKANGPAVIATLKHEIPGLIPVEPEGGKVARVNAVSPEWEAGNVYLPDPSIAPWVEAFVEELVNFPNAAHDDDVDAMSQALLRFRQRRAHPTVNPIATARPSAWRA